MVILIIKFLLLYTVKHAFFKVVNKFYWSMFYKKILF